MREKSFEEMHFFHLGLSEQGRELDAIREAQALNEQAERQMQNVLGDIKGAISYIVAAGERKPNRLDICAGPRTGANRTSDKPNESYTTLAPNSVMAAEEHFGLTRQASDGISMSSQYESAFVDPRTHDPSMREVSANGRIPGPSHPSSNPFSNTRAAQIASAKGYPVESSGQLFKVMIA